MRSLSSRPPRIRQAGAFCIIEEIAPLDTPLHVHEHEDELFYVLEGEHVFRSAKRSSTPVRATRVRATRGPSRAAARGAAHGAIALARLPPASRASSASLPRRSAPARSGRRHMRASPRSTGSPGSSSHPSGSSGALLPLRVRRIHRVRLHADLTILPKLAYALARANGVPIAV